MIIVMKIDELLTQKDVLFITTKNLSYIRNVQEISLIKSYAKTYHIIGSNSSKYIFRLISIVAQLLRADRNKYSVCFVGFAPQLILPFIRKKLKNKLVIQDFFISLYDTFCLDRQKFSPNSWIGKLLHKLDAATLSLSDYIITDTKIHGKFFVEEFNADTTKLITLYLDASHITSRFPHLTNQKESTFDPFKVLYFGSILPLQGIEVILEAAKLLKAEHNIHFEIIGPLKAEHKKICSANSNITLINWLEEEALYEHIRKADLCLAGHFSSSIDKAQRTIPGKAFIYQAFNIPMILGDTPANHEIFCEDNRFIYFVPTGDPSALASKIKTLSTQDASSPF